VVPMSSPKRYSEAAVGEPPGCVLPASMAISKNQRSGD
jgi:hypothetical protein